MQAKVVDKKNGTSRSRDIENLALDRPSIVFLKLAPESVARYERRGDDLVLVLKDGQEIVVHDFYVQYQKAEHPEPASNAEAAAGEVSAAGNDRSDLVLIDDNGVAWWGQYTSPWSEFHFTEIEWGGGALAAWWPWVLGALGVAGVALAAGGGGGHHRNGPPVATDDTATGLEDGGPVTGNVLTNDRNGGSGTPTVTQFTVNGATYNAGNTATIPGVGTLVINGNGSYTFTPAANFNGNVPVATYTISDGKGGTDTADLRITIDPVNDAPDAVGSIPAQSSEDSNAVGGVDVTSYFNDIDSSTLTYSASGLPAGLSIDPNTGVISGTVDRSASQGGPDSDGEYSVTVTATDGDGATVSQTFTWTVTNPVPVANDDVATTVEDTPVSGNVLGGTGAGANDVADSDPDGDALSVTTFEVNGTTYNAGDTATITGVGTLVLNTDGSYTFTPAANYHGTVPTVTYTISDGEGGSDTATLGIQVTPVNDTPVAVNDARGVDEDAPPLTGNVVDNDTLGDDTRADHTVTWDASDVAQYGTITRNPDGSYTYELDNTNPVVNALKDGETLTETFTYTLTDLDGETSTATLTITINGHTDGEPGITVQDGNGGDGSDFLQAGHVSVYESGLAGGAGSTVATGSIDVSTPDGLATVTIGGITLTQAQLEALSVATPVTIPAAHGTITLTGYVSGGEVGGVSTGGTIAYTYTLASTVDNDSEAGATDDNRIVQIPVSVLDQGGATQSGTLQVNIIDDAPVANDDSATVDTVTLLASGNVITTGAGADVQGADGPATVTAIVSNNVSGNTPSTGVGGELTIDGQYGQLVIHADGSYTYTRTPGSAGGVDDVFGYTLTDADGDTATATLTISIPDNAVTGPEVSVPAPGDASATVYESGLPAGTDAAANTEQVAGSFTFTSTDGVQSLTVNGTDVTGATAGSPVIITTPEGHTLSITGYSYDPVTGAGTVNYTYTLTGNEAHATGAGSNTLTDSLPIVLTDADGDTSPASNLVLTIVDDIPQAAANGAGNPTLEVDESDLATNATGSFAGLFTLHHGADGAAATDGTVYTLTVDAGVPSGLVDTLSGATVVLSVSGNVVTGSAAGETVFTITIDPQTGDVTLDQRRAVEHADTSDPDDAVSLAAGAVGITLTVTDTDGDTATASADIGDRFTFKDDGPAITTGLDGGFIQPTLNTQDADTIGAASDVATASFAGAFTAAPVPGADGATTVWTYALGVTSAASGLTSGGVAITLAMVGATVVGSAGGIPVFEVSVNASGSVTLTQHEPIDHADSADPGETIVLAGGLITLTGTATITDGDGDSASSSQTINLSGISFSDDGVTLGTAVDATVYESNLQWGSDPDAGALTQTGTLNVTSLGGDGAATGATAVATFAATQTALEALGLTAGGDALIYAVTNNGHTLTATANGATVFTVTITNPDTTSAGYSFVLARALDHGADAVKVLPFAVVVEDGDGDVADTGFNVTVVDDVISDAPRTMTVVEDSTAAAAVNTINTTADANVTTTDPSHGTVSVNSTGQITYVPDANYSGTDTFTYTITNDDGAPITTTVTVTVTPVSDAPTLPVDGAIPLVGGVPTVTTSEDVAVGLGLKTPVITDNTDQNGAGTAGDHGERIGAITLTVQNANGGANTTGATLTKDDGTALVPTAPGGSSYTIVIVGTSGGTDVDTDLHRSSGLPTANVNYLTQAEYEALLARPANERHENFRVQVSATSYEVDDGGNQLGAVTGATSTRNINVRVQAVTDPVDLKIDDGGGNYVDAATPAAAVDVAMSEDTVFNLTPLLQVILDTAADGNAVADIDGSEARWFTITGLPEGSLVNGHAITAAEAVGGYRVDIAGNYNGVSPSLPAINITAPSDFSGDIDGVRITLNAQDRDSDGIGAGATTGALQSDSVYVNLRVAPVADDVNVTSPAAAPEDTNIAFLAGISHTDADSNGGSERITEVSFTVPAGWTLTDPGIAGVTVTTPGGVTTIAFDASLSQAAIEAALDAFMIRPPAHSSADATVQVTIDTADTNTVDGVPLTATGTVTRPIVITVTPVAERTDTDSDAAGGNDVTMTAGHVYATPGLEDTWFDLSTDAGFVLADGWSNADADEELYAVLTPSLSSTEPSDTVIGTQFTYYDTVNAVQVTETYVGEAIWVPAAYLSTLQVKLPSDVSGTLTIAVQAGTIDTDPDSGATVRDVSGSATLSLIEINPAADAVTMALNGRASGVEDTDIPLAIKTTSSDTSETFNVTIAGIPNGAKIVYGGVEQTVSGGSVTILSFSNTTPLTITPPANSNEDFQLMVSAVSVDGTDTSAPVSRTIDVSVTGVADTPVVTLAPAYGTDEATLDSTGLHRVALSNLVASASSPDSDGSEVVTLRITGLAEGFSVTGATMVTSGTGAERVWLVGAGSLGGAAIVVPTNYSGTVNFQVAGVTTENDGDSFTGTPTNVSFTVTPSPEATLSTSATLVEDEITALDLAVVHHNGDTNETLGAVYVAVGYDTSSYTLYLNGTELSAAGLATIDISGTDYYVIPAGQVANLGAMGATNLDGDLGSLSLMYEVIDPSSDGTLTAVSEIKAGSVALSATPVTDAVDASIDAITLTTGTTADVTPGDDAMPDTATVTSGGIVTVNLHVDSADTDGSEHLTRVLIDGVPDGVTVIGAAQIGSGSWLLVYDGIDAQSIDATGVDVPVQFVVGHGAGNGTSTITMTALVQDRGNDGTTPAAIETDSVSWNLVLDLGPGAGDGPPLIDQWQYNGAAGTEDTGFTLASVIDAAVSTPSDTVNYIYTVVVTGLPEGSTVSGMTLTSIGGVPTWTATVVASGANSQAALDDLLADISITPPPNSNDNNADFGFSANLTAAAVGGIGVHADTNTGPDGMPIVPVTDEAAITVVTSDVDEGTNSVTATITAADLADGAYGQVVDGRLYVQVSTTTSNGVSNDGGTVSIGGVNQSTTAVTGVSGIADGDYYVIDIGVSGGSVALTYTAAPGDVLQPGGVTFTAWAQTQESGASNVESASAADTADIVIVNNGVTVTSSPVTGDEAASSDKASAIELAGLSVALNDGDGSETIQSILLSGVPVGFLLYVGNNAGDATQAANAGGDGATNTWVLSAGGTLPAYVAILPASHWSGTLSGLALVVESGESSLSSTRVQTIALETVTVTAVANGITIDPTVSFGIEGGIIDLNLNASMGDPVASAVSGDSSTETTTLQIAGLGEHAAFYVDGTLFTSVSYDQATDTYTVSGLSQDNLDKLGFVQAASALTDQDSGAGGTQVSVTAWTVESDGDISASVMDTLTVALTAVTATTGNDNFIWSDAAINGRAGTDTVALRYGEDVTHTELANLLRNVEVIDLSVPGANSISGGLSVADVLTITGSSSGTLTIKGDSDDAVELSSGWSTTGVASGGYVTYTNSGMTLLIDEDIHNNNHVTYAA